MDANGSVDRAESRTKFSTGLLLRLLMAVAIFCTAFRLCRESLIATNRISYERCVFKMKKSLSLSLSIVSLITIPNYNI